MNDTADNIKRMLRKKWGQNCDFSFLEAKNKRIYCDIRVLSPPLEIKKYLKFCQNVEAIIGKFIQKHPHYTLRAPPHNAAHLHDHAYLSSFVLETGDSRPKFL
jgi:hypothetical protein